MRGKKSSYRMSVVPFKCEHGYWGETRAAKFPGILKAVNFHGNLSGILGIFGNFQKHWEFSIFHSALLWFKTSLMIS